MVCIFFGSFLKIVRIQGVSMVCIFFGSFLKIVRIQGVSMVCIFIGRFLKLCVYGVCLWCVYLSEGF
jgi:hypothetical protein